MRRESGPTQADVTLAEVASVIARAADLATGQPLDHVVRSCAIASLFAERLGLAPDVRDATYWVSLLMVSGCSAVSFELSRLFGDDIAVRGGGYDLGPSAIAQVRYVFGRVGGDAPLLTKTRVRVQLLGSKLRPFVNARDPRHCSINARLADRLGLGPEVGEALKVSFAQWNGGIPEGLGGNLNPPAGGAVETRVATPFCRAVDRATVTSRLAPTPEAALTPAGAAIITPAATQRTRKRFTICCSPSPRDGKALLIPHDDVAAQVTTRPTAICTRRAGLARLQVGRVLVILGVMAMAPNEALDQVAAELRLVCRRGLTAWNLADPGFPRLEAIFGGAAAARQGMAASLEAAAVSAAELLGGERATAARRLFGVDPGTRGLTLTVRRERAASAIHVSPEHFRKRIEPLLLREMAKESIGLTTRLPAKNLEPAEGPILIRTARGVPLIRPLWVGRTQPFILDPTPDARVVDSTHRFDLIEDSLRIDGFDGHFSFRYRGKNASQRTSRVFRDSVLGDSAVDTEMLGLRAVDRTTRQPLELVVREDYPYEKLFEVFFREPLKPGEAFDIEISCWWPGTFIERNVLLFFPMHSYLKGVGELRASVTLPAMPMHVDGLQFRGKHVHPAATQPVVERTGKKSFVTWTVHQPKLLHMLQFGRSDLTRPARR